MNKISILLGSFIAGLASVMQIWLDIIVFHNDFICRQGFSYANTSIYNKMNCINSLNDLEQWHCTCRDDGTLYDVNNQGYDVEKWMRIFDDGSVALASLTFIVLVVVEVIRSCVMIPRICGDEISDLTTCEYCSPMGFFALILNPSSFDEYIPSRRGESCMIIVDMLSVGLIFQYCKASNTSINDPFILVVLIINCCNALRSILIQYRINSKHHSEKLKKKLQRISPPAYENLP